MVHETEEAAGAVVAQLREGIGFIRATPKVKWSLLYLGHRGVARRRARRHRPQLRARRARASSPRTSSSSSCRSGSAS